MAQKRRENHPLTPKQAKFVEHFIATGNAKQSAIAAGAKATSAHQLAYQWMKTPKVRKAVEEGRKFFQKKTGYGLAEAMNEAEEAMELARSQPTGASAFVKAVELRAKLNGLIEKKDSGPVAPAFTINIIRRGGEGNEASPVIDVNPVLTIPSKID